MSCKVCGTTLTGNQIKYCSKKCKAIHGYYMRKYGKYPVLRYCQNPKCPNPTRVLPSKQTKFCSRTCWNETRRLLKHHTFKSKDLGKVICPVCGEEGRLYEITWTDGKKGGTFKEVKHHHYHRVP